MTRRIEEEAVGYPGFLVARPPRLSRTTATFKRVALAKLADITRLSAKFGGEDQLFEPWLTVLIDRGKSASLTGVYRTDTASARPGESERYGEGPERTGDTAPPIWCLRSSEWFRDHDVEHAGHGGEIGDYLTSGPQISNRFVFANRTTHPEVDTVMSDATAVLVRGITVSAAQPRPAEWQYVDVELSDHRLICRVEYSPLIAHSAALEGVLPDWLDRVDDLLKRDGIPPDDRITLSLRRSVPEITRAAPRAHGLP